jgi:hypothetical protein
VGCGGVYLVLQALWKCWWDVAGMPSVLLSACCWVSDLYTRAVNNKPHNTAACQWRARMAHCCLLSQAYRCRLQMQCKWLPVVSAGCQAWHSFHVRATLSPWRCCVGAYVEEPLLAVCAQALLQLEEVVALGLCVWGYVHVQGPALKCTAISGSVSMVPKQLQGSACWRSIQTVQVAQDGGGVGCRCLHACV